MDVSHGLPTRIVNKLQIYLGGWDLKLKNLSQQISTIDVLKILFLKFPRQQIKNEQDLILMCIKILDIFKDVI